MGTPSSQKTTDPPAAAPHPQSHGRGGSVRSTLLLVPVAVFAVFAGLLGVAVSPPARRLTAFALLTVTSLASNSCDPGPPAAPRPPDPPRVWDVSVGDLMRSAPAYQGRVVRVHLPAGSYGSPPNTGEIHFPSPTPGSPPAVVWELIGPPPPNAGVPVTLTGTVRGVIPDGHPRTSTVSYQTRVGGATWIQPPPDPGGGVAR